MLYNILIIIFGFLPILLYMATSVIKYISREEVLSILQDKNLLIVLGEAYLRRSARQREKASKKIEINTDLSPYSNRLLNDMALSPWSKIRLALDFKKDDININEIEKKQEVDDPLYVAFNSAQMGITLEYWVCLHMRCCCGGRFFKYASMNKPIVDVCCVNEKHDNIKHGPKYYQIKSSESERTYKGLKYFDIENNFICVGSINKGYNAHMLKPTDDLRTLIGYICIYYTQNDNIITVSRRKSYMCVPKMDIKNISPMDIKKTYYNYNIIDDINKVTLTKDMFNIYSFSDLTDQILTVNVDAQYHTVRNNSRFENPPVLNLDESEHIKPSIIYPIKFDKSKPDIFEKTFNYIKPTEIDVLGTPLYSKIEDAEELTKISHMDETEVAELLDPIVKQVVVPILVPKEKWKFETPVKSPQRKKGKLSNNELKYYKYKLKYLALRNSLIKS